ncbi:hypothetical protein NLI96_g5217 [Meripilus lineatus]|uniref:Uncharacterized protein n=1 Tax=Meripilus lineatus TaxID=2056292 RepID=A0AAD5V838_9APHY|nr:hypothetical protein NLI96_g5217 [Physisporinus lineatus]
MNLTPPFKLRAKTATVGVASTRLLGPHFVESERVAKESEALNASREELHHLSPTFLALPGTVPTLLILAWK